MARTTITVICAVCGNQFNKEPRKFNPNQQLHFCNRNCWRTYRRTKWRPTKKQLMAFKHANENRHTQKILRDESRMETFICDYCHQSFRRIHRWRRNYNKTFCSKICSALGQERWSKNPNGSNRTRQSLKAMMKCRFVDECCICGWHVLYNDTHHIIQNASGGPSILSNALFLCPNHHRMADRGLITIDELRTAQANLRRLPGVPDKAYEYL